MRFAALPFRFAIVAVLTCLCAAPASAEDAKPSKLVAFLPATVGAKACYTRRYDGRHLAEHPKQRVTALTFLMRVVGIDMSAGGDWVLDPNGKYDRVNYQFAMSVTRRAGKPLAASGYCPEEGADVSCIRECDGGGVMVEKAADALLIRLDEFGILMGACDEKGTWLKAGADDKSFRVEKVAVEQCAALEKSEFGE